MENAVAQLPVIPENTPPVAPNPVIGAAAQLLAPLVGESKWLTDTLQQLPQFSAQNGTLALLGEFGTGKSLLARHVHWHSPRAAAPCVMIDLRGMPHEIVETELFGYTRGGFLTRRAVVPGRVATAENGTCIIQGFELLPAVVQERCLPWLTAGRLQPVGTEESFASDARVILELRGRDFSKRRSAALIPAIVDLVEGRMLEVESLAKRREDIVPIAEHYLQRYGEEWGKPRVQFSADVVRMLKKASWPRNVRSLLAAVASAVQEVDDELVEMKHFPPAFAGRPSAVAEVGIDATALEDIVEEKLRRFFGRLGQYEVHELYSTVIGKIERPLFRLVLEQTKGNQVRAARVLGINRNTLRTRMKKLGLMPDKE